MSHSDTVPSTSSDQGGFEVLDAEHLDARLNAVRDALRLCPTEVPASLSIPAHKALDAVAQRLALGDRLGQVVAVQRLDPAELR